MFAYGEPEVLADDSILLNGTSQGWWVSAVFKFKEDGALDTSFGNNGIAEIVFEANGGKHSNDLILQSDGKIVAVGDACVDRAGEDVTWHGALPDRATIAGFNPNGTIDTDFAIAGGQQFNWTSLITFTDIKELSDGRLVVGATGNDGLDFHAYMARFNANGSLDTTFDANGWAEMDVFPNSVFKGFEVIDDNHYFMLGNTVEPATPFMASVWQP